MEADIWTVFQGLGALLAVAVAVGLAVLNLMKDRRFKTDSRKADHATHEATLESDVAQIKQALSGTPASPYEVTRPGLIERLNNVETAQLATTATLTTLVESVDSLNTFVRNGTRDA